MKNKRIKCKDCDKTFTPKYWNGIIKSRLCPNCTYRKAFKKANKKANNQNDKVNKKRNNLITKAKPVRTKRTKILKKEDVFNKNGSLTNYAITHYRDVNTKHLKTRAVHWFNKFIRFRDTDEHGYGTCISSGQPLVLGTSNAQAGHFYPRGLYPALAFNEDNVHLQGKSDNYFKSGNLIEYRKRLLIKIGETRLQELDRIAAAYKKIGWKESKYLYVEIITEYKDKCEKLNKTKVKNKKGA